MRRVKLTNRKGKLMYATVDDVDYAYLAQFSWYCNGGYAYTFRNGRQVGMHRIIMDVDTSVPIDHKNRRPRDNRRSNLRICTISQNAVNSLGKRNKTGYRGVTLHKPSGLFRAEITVNQKPHCIGYFKTARDASRAYKRKRLEVFGEFSPK